MGMSSATNSLMLYAIIHGIKWKERLLIALHAKVSMLWISWSIKMEALEVTCPYCERHAQMVTGDQIYGEGRFTERFFYLCPPCMAYVGTHKGTNQPLGALADARTREARKCAHAAFDPLWKRKMLKDNVNKFIARSSGYKWLAKALEIEPESCHIGMMTEEQCNRVVEICSKYSK